MSRRRIAVAALLTVALLALIGWKAHRERLVKACLDSNSVWEGARSRCVPPPVRPILQRDLHRS